MDTQNQIQFKRKNRSNGALKLRMKNSNNWDNPWPEDDGYLETYRERDEHDLDGYRQMRQAERYPMEERKESRKESRKDDPKKEVPKYQETKYPKYSVL